MQTAISKVCFFRGDENLAVGKGDLSRDLNMSDLIARHTLRDVFSFIFQNVFNIFMWQYD